MPSDKRARQRRLREEKVAVEQQRVRRRRSVRRAISAVVVVGVVIALVALLSGHSTPPKKAASNKTTTTTKPASTTTSTSTTTTTVATVAAIAPTCPPAAGSAKREINFTKAPPTCVAPTGVYDATVKTDVGTFVIQMKAATALAATNNFVFLARYHFYDGVIFHRVIPGFVVQGGDPTGTGSGGPGYSWTGNTPPKSCQTNASCYPTWSVAMANSGAPTSNGSQFFIVLPGGGAGLSALYTVVGTVVSGTNVVAKIAADGTASGTPKKVHEMIKVTISEVSP
jgi:cyclophilin family peptidyl-prolyl cis-trans isomerase